MSQGKPQEGFINHTLIASADLIHPGRLCRLNLLPSFLTVLALREEVSFLKTREDVYTGKVPKS